jgi:hypothetical protein
MSSPRAPSWSVRSGGLVSISNLCGLDRAGLRRRGDMAGTRRRKITPDARTRITPEAVAAWQAGDYWRLWSALAPPVAVMPDCSADQPYELRDPGWPTCLKWYEQVLSAKAELLELAGPPPKRWSYRSD